ncbi:hydrolase [Peribacillus butanolivorans]|uniref:hydrolase n=1 Tax=Peribacillus butanolivorans TaxID=421767 RepID=UPI003D2B3B98
MMQEKQTYHVDLVSGDVLGKKLEENPSFTIYATNEELAELKQCLEEHPTDDLESYARSHVPYLLYHHDRANDKYDEAMKKLYAIIYKLGDETARNHIEEIGILADNKFKGNEEIQNFK